MCKEKKFRWINDDIKIDFDVNIVLKNAMQEAEEYDLEGNVEYFCMAEAIDVLCKGSVTVGKMTEAQWDLMCARYNLGGC